jgi:hypothetical protein
MPAKRRLADADETAAVLRVAATIANNLFVGQRPDLIAAVLAELMSTFLLNHRIPNDLKRQKELREEMLTEWCATVRDLVAIETAPPISETLQ